MKIRNAGDVLDTVKRLLLWQGWTEAWEEAGTGITNILTNAIIMGGQSDWAKLVEENGGDKWKAFLGMVQSVARDMFGGFLSGSTNAAIEIAPQAAQQWSAAQENTTTQAEPEAAHPESVAPTAADPTPAKQKTPPQIAAVSGKACGI